MGAKRPKSEVLLKFIYFGRILQKCEKCNLSSLLCGLPAITEGKLLQLIYIFHASTFDYILQYYVHCLNTGGIHKMGEKFLSKYVVYACIERKTHSRLKI